MYGCLVKSMVQRREDSSRGTELQTFIFQVKMYNDKTLRYQTTLILGQLLSIVIVTINYLAKFDTILRNSYIFKVIAYNYINRLRTQFGFSS